MESKICGCILVFVLWWCYFWVRDEWVLVNLWGVVVGVIDGYVFIRVFGMVVLLVIWNICRVIIKDWVMV